MNTYQQNNSLQSQSTNKKHKSSKNTILLLATLSVLIAAGIIIFVLKKDNSVATNPQTQNNNTITTGTPISNSTTTNSSSSSSTDTSSQTTTTTKTYEKVVAYSVPENGQNKLTVKLTVSSGKITKVDTSSVVSSNESNKYVDSFESGLNSSGIIGKSTTDNLSLAKIGRASLTTAAFNNAISKIISEVN
jgi:cytoskeletal protein RodZ